jgi:hypothetical protein
MPVDELEEFEFRARAEREAGIRRTPKQMYGAGQKYLSASDDPKNVGLLKAAQSLDEGMTKVGGMATDYLSSKGAPPQVAGAAGTAVKMLPDIATFPLSSLRAATKVGVPLSQMAGRQAEKLMGEALKPTPTQWLSGEGKAAVKTMLEKGLNVSEKSVVKLEAELKSLQDRVSNAIKTSGGTVPKDEVVKTIKQAKDQFKGGTSELDDMKIIDAVVKQFEKAPSVRGMKDIPVQVAQRMKVLEGQKLRDYYGVPGMGPEIAARKGTTRGLKEGIEKVFPEVKELNAEEQKIYRTLPVLERKAMMEIGRDKVGLAFLAHNPKAASAMVIGKSSMFKSWLSNRINQYANSMMPRGIESAGAMSLYEVGKGQ